MGVKVGVPSKGLCFAVTVTSLPGTVKELLAVVAGLVNATSEGVHSLKGMTSPLLPFITLGLISTVSPARKFPLLFAWETTPVPASVPYSTVTV